MSKVWSFHLFLPPSTIPLVTYGQYQPQEGRTQLLLRLHRTSSRRHRILLAEDQQVYAKVGLLVELLQKISILITHSGSDILQTIFSHWFSWAKMILFWAKFHWSFVLKGPIENKALLTQVIAWRQTSIKHYLNQYIWPLGELIFLTMDYCKRNLTPVLIHMSYVSFTLTHWGQATHICLSKLTIMGSYNGLSPGRHQATVWTNAGILLIWTLGTNVSEIWREIHMFSFTKMHFKMSSEKWQPFCLGLNVLIHQNVVTLLVVRLEYSRRTRSIEWLLIPWRHVPPTGG